MQPHPRVTAGSCWLAVTHEAKRGKSVRIPWDACCRKLFSATHSHSVLSKRQGKAIFILNVRNSATYVLSTWFAGYNNDYGKNSVTTHCWGLRSASAKLVQQRDTRNSPRQK
ncbi:hypothetical protein E2C01_092459 [Portunus trituberculatus]|uniref:Uncharacterized protein n=1 Tax=Portunus trituberculatus TaxID=210409 RepID=A0A5B7JXU8_PORTR|nr:hypothetical protein [Portunus trituberculatus]